MNIWMICKEELAELENITVNTILQDCRIKYSDKYDAFFVLNQDKRDIEKTYDILCANGVPVIYDTCLKGYQDMFFYNLYNMFLDNLNIINDDRPDLFYSDFVAWEDFWEEIIMDTLGWCNANADVCIRGYWDFLKDFVSK